MATARARVPRSSSWPEVMQPRCAGHWRIDVESRPICETEGSDSAWVGRDPINPGRFTRRSGGERAPRRLTRRCGQRTSALQQPGQTEHDASEAHRALLTTHRLAGSTNRCGKPDENAKAESFMMRSKVKTVHETFENVTANRSRSTTRKGRAQLSRPRAVRGSTRPPAGKTAAIACPRPGARPIERLERARNSPSALADADESLPGPAMTDALCHGHVLIACGMPIGAVPHKIARKTAEREPGRVSLTKGYGTGQFHQSCRLTHDLSRGRIERDRLAASLIAIRAAVRADMPPRRPTLREAW